MSLSVARVPRIAAWLLCGCTVCVAAAARSIESDLAELEAVNVDWNHRIVFADDADNWGQSDYWATPDELVSQGRGDCEDYAIAKYFALRAAGIPSPQLRLAYTLVSPGASGRAWRPHMVVAYLPSLGEPGGERILDNLLDEIRPLARRPDLRVLISFDTQGVWSGLARGAAAREARQIRPWAQVLQRMSAEHSRVAATSSPRY